MKVRPSVESFSQLVTNIVASINIIEYKKFFFISVSFFDETII